MTRGDQTLRHPAALRAFPPGGTPTTQAEVRLLRFFFAADISYSPNTLAPRLPSAGRSTAMAAMCLTIGAIWSLIAGGLL